MDESGVKKIADELKYFQLIDPNRKIIADKKIRNLWCNFGADGSILFDPTTLNYLDKDGVRFFLLHEEGHIIYRQEKKKRGLLKSKIWLTLFLVTIIPITIPLIFILYQRNFTFLTPFFYTFFYAYYLIELPIVIIAIILVFCLDRLPTTILYR